MSTQIINVGRAFHTSYSTYGFIQLGWLVTYPDELIISNHLAMAGVAVGDALASVSETYCRGGAIILLSLIHRRARR